MKKLFLTLTIVATVCLMTSCFGGGGSAGLVGTWGLTHFEWYEYEDGELVDSESGDVDPDSPIGYDDLKWEISHVDGNDYLFTIYDYNKSKKEWEVDGKQTITIENGKATFDDNETATFKVSGVTLFYLESRCADFFSVDQFFGQGLAVRDDLDSHGVGIKGAEDEGAVGCLDLDRLAAGAKAQRYDAQCQKGWQYVFGIVVFHKSKSNN